MISFLRPILITLLTLAVVSAETNLPEVKPVSESVRKDLKLAPFYQKVIDLDGLPILGSAKVSDAALREAAWILRQMLSEKPGILKAMGKNGVRLVVMAHDEYTTDVPEQVDMKPKDFWDRRARGLGGQIASCAEENLLCFPGDPYNTENILIHEFSHAIAGFGAKEVVPDFDKRLDEAFENAKKAGLWMGTYAGSNRDEYWAEAAQNWFDNNRKNDAQHNAIHTRAQLKEYDPEIAKLCKDVFGEGTWRYQKPSDRPEDQRSHLADFDPSKAPTFKWRNDSADANDGSQR
jgi:hypothetical protein